VAEQDAFDRQLASRLQAAAAQPGERGVERLHEATTRGRRIRRRRRHLAAAAVVAAAVMVPVVWVATVTALHRPGRHALTPADQVRLVGTFAADVPPQTGADAAAAGGWTLTLRGDGTVGLAGPAGYRGVLSGSSYQVAGSTVRINLFVQDRCSADPVGQYRWAQDGAGLHFTVMSDTCAFRRAVLTASVWRPGT
jgi:hypothetical protein